MTGVEPIAIVGARSARPAFHNGKAGRALRAVRARPFTTEKRGTIPADNIKEDTT